MNPAVIIEFIVKYGIPALRGVIEICKVKDPTAEDWEKVFKPAERGYEDYIAEAKAKANQT